MSDLPTCHPAEIPQDIWLDAERAAADIRALVDMPPHCEAEIIAREILAERTYFLEMLSNPAAVRVNYLRGTIACQNLIDEAKSEERERCALLIEHRAIVVSTQDGPKAYREMTRKEAAALIRSGGAS